MFICGQTFEIVLQPFFFSTKEVWIVLSPWNFHCYSFQWTQFRVFLATLTRLLAKISLHHFVMCILAILIPQRWFLLLQKLKPYLQYQPCSQTLTWTIHPLLPESFHFPSKVKENPICSPPSPCFFIIISRASLHLSKVRRRWRDLLFISQRFHLAILLESTWLAGGGSSLSDRRATASPLQCHWSKSWQARGPWRQ